MDTHGKKIKLGKRERKKKGEREVDRALKKDDLLLKK